MPGITGGKVRRRKTAGVKKRVHRRKRGGADDVTGGAKRRRRVGAVKRRVHRKRGGAVVGGRKRRVHRKKGGAVVGGKRRVHRKRAAVSGVAKKRRVHRRRAQGGAGKPPSADKVRKMAQKLGIPLSSHGKRKTKTGLLRAIGYRHK